MKHNQQQQIDRAIRILKECYSDIESRREAAKSYVMFFQQPRSGFDAKKFMAALEDN